MADYRKQWEHCLLMSGDQMQILVVDDDPRINELIRYSLERYHYKVITASDGVDALQLARRLRPDLIILDVMLPGLDGYEICTVFTSSPVALDISA